MSIENFCDRHPANPSVRGIVENRREAEKQYDKSLPVILAEQLAIEGRDGVRDLINKLSLSNTMFKLGRKGFQKLPAQDQQHMIKHYAAIVFGNLVRPLEQTVVNGEYDHEDFRAAYNLHIRDLQIDEEEVRTEKKEKLSVEQLARMRSFVKEDPTFAILFEEKGAGALPNTLRQFLENERVMPVIREAILPIYKPRAKFLV